MRKFAMVFMAAFAVAMGAAVGGETPVAPVYGQSTLSAEERAEIKKQTKETAEAIFGSKPLRWGQEGYYIARGKLHGPEGIVGELKADGTVVDFFYPTKGKIGHVTDWIPDWKPATPESE